MHKNKKKTFFCNIFTEVKVGQDLNKNENIYFDNGAIIWSNMCCLIYSFFFCPISRSKSSAETVSNRSQQNSLIISV